MKIRDGFVTNSSSTNFMIIAKEELTAEYLMEKMGLKPHSLLTSEVSDLVYEIISGTRKGVRWFEVDEINYDVVKKIYGDESANKYKELSDKGYHTYIGYTSSDDECLASFMTMDSFVIDEKDFYMDGRNCVW